MGFLAIAMLLFADTPVENLAKKMRPIYRKEIAEYSMSVEVIPVGKN